MASTQKQKTVSGGSVAGSWNAAILGSTALGGFWCALEKKVENYLAFLHLACARLIFAKVLVFG